MWFSQLGTRGMLERRVYHVMRREDDSWQVIKEGFKRPHVIGRSKEEAILLARRLAKVIPESKVVVHNDDRKANQENEFKSHAA
jgi:hypothetical protein